MPLQLAAGERLDEREQGDDVGALRRAVVHARAVQPHQTRCPLLREDDPLRAHVAMRSAGRVQGGERPREPAPDLEHAGVGERRCERVESLTLHESRHDVWPRTRFVDVVHAGQVRVRGARERARDGQAPAARVRRFGEEREDDRAIERTVMRQESHAVPPQGTDEPVVVERLLVARGYGKALVDHRQEGTTDVERLVQYDAARTARLLVEVRYDVHVCPDWSLRIRYDVVACEDDEDRIRYDVDELSGSLRRV